MMPVVKKQSADGKKAKTSGMQSAWDLTETLSLLMYGRSGTGKTTLWATFPKPILVAVCSGGLKPGELRSINTPELRKVITAYVIRESAQLGKLIEYDSADFATIVLDHLTGLQDLVLKEILGLDELPAQKSWGMASQQQYGQCTLQCKEMLRAFLSLSCHRVIVAQEREFNTDTDSELLMPYVGAAATPSLVGWLNPACDYIGQTFIREKTEEKQVKVGGKITVLTKKSNQKEFCLRTAPDAVFTTKFRLPKGTPLPDVIVDPSYQKIERIVKGEWKEPNASIQQKSQ